MSKPHKLPINKITVLGIEYSIVLKEKVYNDDGERCWGTVDLNKFVISLQDAPMPKVVKTLCHEIVHIWQDAMSMPVDEDVASKIEVVMADLFYNQPEVVKFLQRKAW